jgi:hypothetical protein
MRPTAFLRFAAALTMAAAVGAPLRAQVAPASRPDWAGDLAFLAAELPKRHVAPFHRLPEEEWRKRVEAVRAELPGLDDALTVVAFQRLAAALGDSHTTVRGDRQSPPSTWTFRLPAAVQWVKEGAVFWALPAEHAAALGRPILSVGGVPWDEAAARLATTFAYDNDSWRKEGVMGALLDAANLRALGLSRKDGATEFVLAGNDGGAPTTVALRAPKDNVAAKAVRFARKPDVADFAPTLALDRPIYGRRRIDESRTLFVWYDACRTDPQRPLDKFVAETLAEIDGGFAAEPPTLSRVVVDLRRNGGGNSSLLDPFIFALKNREAVNRTEALAVLIGRRTFSSALLNAATFRRTTKARLLGEPTGGAPGHFGEIRSFRLPSSQLVVWHSTKRFGDGKSDRATLEPDVLVETDLAAFLAGRDPAFAAATR